MIEVYGLGLHYGTGGGRVAAIQDVSIRVSAGERLGLFGPSGSGKTTLLRCIAGLETPQRGTIRMAGVEVFNAQSGTNAPPWHRPIGVVFQDFALWPHMRVRENVLFPLQHGRPNALTHRDRQKLVSAMLRKVGLGELAERYPAQLSGGERQRVAVARALVSRPDVLLMDEPLSNLDSHLRRQTRDELLGILEGTDVTTILVSHDQLDCLFMTHSVGVLRDGKLVQTGPSDEVLMHPASASVARTLGCGGLLKVRCASDTQSGEFHLVGTGQSLSLPDFEGIGESPSDAVLLIRRNACKLWRDSEIHGRFQKLVGRTVKVGYTVSGWCVLVDLGGVSIEVWEMERPQLTRGQPVEIAVDIDQVQVLPND